MMPKTLQGSVVPLDDQSSFGQPAQEVLVRLRDAMKGLIDALPGPVSRAVELQNSLGIYSTLAWQTFKIANSPEPLDVVEHILTPAMVNKLLAAAEKKGVPHAVIHEIRAAMEAYAVLLHEHADDTAALMMMLTSLQPEKKNLLDETLRKGAFQHNRLIWGKQIDVLLNCLIISADRNPPTILISGTIGFHQTRPGRSDIILKHAHRVTSPDRAAPGDEPDFHHSVLTEFSSPGLNLDINQEPDQNYTTVAPSNLGRKCAVDYFQMLTYFAPFQRKVPIGSRLTTTIATKMSHLDIVVLGDTGPRPMSAHVYARRDVRPTELVQECLPEDLLPIELSPAYLGSFVDMPAGKGVPRYPEMIRSVLSRFGYYGRKFDVYRCRMPYPILNSLVRLSVDPNQPDSGESTNSSNGVMPRE